MERQTSEGTLLGGKLRYRQLLVGHRTGFEPVLLAASIPSRAGDTVLELGTGAGAGLLCLAHRVPGIFGVGVEMAELASLAADNFAANRLTGLAAVQADAGVLPFGRVFDHVFANPPWHDGRGTSSADPLRALARHATAGLLECWIATMLAATKPFGTLTLILPSPALGRVQAALVGDHKVVSVLPLLPRLGRQPKQMIVRIRQSTAATAVLPGLVLHDEMGITRDAEAVLRHGAALPF